MAHLPSSSLSTNAICSDGLDVNSGHAASVFKLPHISHPFDGASACDRPLQVSRGSIPIQGSNSFGSTRTLSGHEHHGKPWLYPSERHHHGSTNSSCGSARVQHGGVSLSQCYFYDSLLMWIFQRPCNVSRWRIGTIRGRYTHNDILHRWRRFPHQLSRCPRRCIGYRDWTIRPPTLQRGRCIGHAL